MTLTEQVYDTIQLFIVHIHVRRGVRGGVLTAEILYRLEFGVGQPPMILLLWGAEFNLRRRGYVIRPLGAEGECAICRRRAPLYVDVEGVWMVCLRCRPGRQEASPGQPWRFRIVTG